MTNVWEKWVDLHVKAEIFKAQTFAENGGLHADPHPNLGLFAFFEMKKCWTVGINKTNCSWSLLVKWPVPKKIVISIPIISIFWIYIYNIWLHMYIHRFPSNQAPWGCDPPSRAGLEPLLKPPGALQNLKNRSKASHIDLPQTCKQKKHKVPTFTIGVLVCHYWTDSTVVSILCCMLM